MISVIVQAKRRSGKPRDCCAGGQRARIAQVTYTRLKTCCTVTITGDRTWPEIMSCCRVQPPHQAEAGVQDLQDRGGLEDLRQGWVQSMSGAAAPAA
jgi:hypothetical protein